MVMKRDKSYKEERGFVKRRTIKTDGKDMYETDPEGAFSRSLGDGRTRRALPAISTRNNADPYYKTLQNPGETGDASEATPDRKAQSHHRRFKRKDFIQKNLREVSKFKSAEPTREDIKSEVNTRDSKEGSTSPRHSPSHLEGPRENKWNSGSGALSPSKGSTIQAQPMSLRLLELSKPKNKSVRDSKSMTRRMRPDPREGEARDELGLQNLSKEAAAKRGTPRAGAIKFRPELSTKLSMQIYENVGFKDVRKGAAPKLTTRKKRGGRKEKGLERNVPGKASEATLPTHRRV